MLQTLISIVKIKFYIYSSKLKIVKNFNSFYIYFFLHIISYVMNKCNLIEDGN